MDAIAVTYNCPNCGAELYFNADKQKLCCEFCESEFTNEEILSHGLEEAAERREIENADYCEQMNDCECSNCGAEFSVPENTAAGICIYCESPVILKGKLSGQMKPDKVIPFKYGKEEAERKFLEFTKKRWFLPKGFAEKKRAEKISGIYYPFWVTDADTDASLVADATKVRTWRVGNKRYTETSKYCVERAGYIHFEDIVTSAISEDDKAMLEGVLPYPSESLTPFDMSYLSGFSAKKRNIERESLSAEVKARMDGYASTLLRNTIDGYASVSVRQNRLFIRQSHWEYSLMPIWILNYRTKKKMYTYAMNGYTGKIYGELPICIKKLSIAAAGLFTVLAGIAALIGGIIL